MVLAHAPECALSRFQVKQWMDHQTQAAQKGEAPGPAELVPADVPEAHPEPGRAGAMVLTKTTRENLANVQRVVYDPQPLLLEGDTGVGKSATIEEAWRVLQAQLGGAQFIRFNMSARITSDDLLGRVMLCTDGPQGREHFKFQPQPFTEAFQGGHWLLLDELNLAPEQVLQVIESALDTQALLVNDTSSSANPMRRIPMHPNFRLFCTQNPNAHMFKGFRTSLSPSFLTRCPLSVRGVAHELETRGD